MNLFKELSNSLPNHTFRLLYIKSEPKQCNTIIKFNSHHSKFPNPDITIKIKHFLTIIDDVTLIPLVGIEVYSYLLITKDNVIQYLFVSKIDTTGCLTIKVNVSGVMTTFLRFLMTFNHSSITYRQKGVTSTTTIKKIHKLIEKPRANYTTIQLPSAFKTKISLFTKSSNQYFFPNSDKNPHKHLIDGDKLLKWWLNVLDNAVSQSDVSFDKKLIIPGSSTSNKYLLDGWKLGSIYGEGTPMAIYSIPNFPDDPKTRFLEFLIIENRAKLDLDQYYLELGFRQEFRLGNVVGIIGCELDWYGVDTATDATTDSTDHLQLTNRHYKRLINIIKSEDFSNIDDVQLLVTEKLPFFFALVNKDYDFKKVTGSFNPVKKEKQPEIKVNNVSGLVRKKKKV